jgi:hypothetical protein
MNFARIFGPALAGALLAVPELGVGGVFVAIAAMYVLVLLTLIRLPAGQAIASGRERDAWQQLLAGRRSASG